MSVPPLARLIALALVALSDMAVAQTLLEPEPALADFGERWAWARESAAARSDDSAWAGFSFETPPSIDLPRSLPSSHRRSWYRGYDQGQHGEFWSHRPGLNARLPDTDTLRGAARSLALVLRYASGRLLEVHLLDPEAGIEWRGLDIYWAGRAGADEALMALETIAESSLSPQLKTPILLSLGLPDSPRRFDLLTGLLADAAWAADRVTLINSLALQLTPQVQTLLGELAGDANGAVRERHAAIIGLAGLDSARAMLMDLSGPAQPLAIRRAALTSLDQHAGVEVDRLLLAATAADQAPELGLTAVRLLGQRAGQTATLRRLLREHPLAELRREAMDALVETDPDGNFTVLQWVSENDRSPDNRRKAIESLRQVSADLAIPTLTALADDVTLAPRLRREAVETLARFDADRVRASLNRLAWSDQDERVRAEAVEGLARLRELPANALLLELAKSHPSPDTREEALERLEETLF